MNPLDYSLCDQIVTVYHKSGETVTRKVIPNAHLSKKVSTPNEGYGKSKEKTFLLIIPEDFPIFPGDRIYAGIGPETVDWQSFVLALVSEVYEAAFAKPCCWMGEVTHWEAGNRKEKL